MYLPLEHVPGNRAADQGTCNIIEEARQHEYNCEQSQTATPAVWQECWHVVRDSTLLEMTRQDRETHQQQKQVGEDPPFVLKLKHQAGQALALSEARKQKLVKCDGHKPSQRHLKCLVVEYRYTQQRQAEQDEIDWNTKQVDGVCRVEGSTGSRRRRIDEEDT